MTTFTAYPYTAVIGGRRFVGTVWTTSQQRAIRCAGFAVFAACERAGVEIPTPPA